MKSKTNSAFLFVAGSLTTALMSLCLVGCDAISNGSGSNSGAAYGDYQDPLHPEYMATPTEVHFPDSALVYLSEADYATFKKDLFGFMDLLYSSPFFEGEIYDVALAEVKLRHHMVFQKRWTGNYKNSGRTLSERYPGASITYMDTTYLDTEGDTIYKRHITAEAQRSLYAARASSSDTTREGGIRWLNEGWQSVPSVANIMDSSAVTSAWKHRDEFGYIATLRADSTAQE